MTQWSSLQWAAFDDDQEKLLQNLPQQTTLNEHPSSGLVSSTIQSDLSLILHRICLAGHLSTCRLFLCYLFHNDCQMDHFAFLHERDDLGNTPLHIAASNGHEYLIQCLLDHGTNYSLKNVYDNMPLQVSQNEKCRRVLRKAGENQWDEDDSRRKFQKQVQVYQDNIDELEMMVQRLFLCEALEKSNTEVMERLVSNAKLFGLPHKNVQKATTCLEWMYTRESLVSAIDMVNHQCPIDHDEKLDCVNNLLHLIQETERKIKDTTEQQANETCQSFIKVPNFISSAHQNALFIHKKSMAEYELSLIVHCLESVKLDDRNDVVEEVPILKLKNAIETAMAQNADSSFVQLASNLLEKLTYELELQAFLKGAPTMKLPVPDMTAKEVASYWEQGRDIGYLDETDGYYPLPHPEHGYVWNKSESLQALESYLKLLNEKIEQASQLDVSPKLLDLANATQTEKQDELNILLEKNENDRLVAIEVAEKAAKHQKKKKQKKKNGKM